MGTQDLYDYYTQAEAYSLTPPSGKYVFLGDPNEVPVHTASYKGKFIEPLVVPYGQPFSIHVELYDAVEVPNETIKWQAKIGDWSRAVSGVSIRSFDIADLPAPAVVGANNTLEFTIWKEAPGKNGSPAFSNPRTVVVPLYTVLDFSKPLDNGGVLPKKSMIFQALIYNSGETLEEYIIENITNGIFNDPHHIYSGGEPLYASADDACDQGRFYYSLYATKRGEALQDPNVAITLDCVAASYLSVTLLRSIGICHDLFGFQKQYNDSNSLIFIDTNAIHTSGNLGWIFYEFKFHQLNASLTGLYDPVVHFRNLKRPKDQNGTPVLAMSESTYRSSLIYSGDRPGTNCTNGSPGIMFLE